MDALPFITCLCPTYRRPRLLENSIACFLSQDYPADRRRLIILDDAGQHRAQYGPGWFLFPGHVRYPDLPAKYAALAALCDVRTDVFAIWEDDDVYLPHHLSTHAAAIARGFTWSKPSRVLSNYTRQIEEEDATGRFFATIAVTRTLWEFVGGVTPTKRADFDQQTLSRLAAAGGAPGDPLQTSPARIPGFCFRWGLPDQNNCQGFMSGGPGDETWYDRRKDAGDATPWGAVHPQLDAETAAIFARFGPPAAEENAAA